MYDKQIMEIVVTTLAHQLLDKASGIHYSREALLVSVVSLGLR
jgi:hypothetical protein